jgi:hypothetical protein
VLRQFRRALNLVIYGGSRRLSVGEDQLLKLAAQVLPRAERDTLRDQLDKLERVKRYNSRRMVTFQFDRVEVPLFADTSPELCLVRYEFEGAGRGKPAKPFGALIIHKGRLSSLELKSAPESLSEKQWARVRPFYRGDNPRVAESLDREEHGNDAQERE